MPRPNTMGLTRRDVARIKALAESAPEDRVAVAISNLDAPWKVAAMIPDDVRHTSGEPFGTWAGRTLVAWFRPKPGISQAEYRAGEKAAMDALRASQSAP